MVALHIVLRNFALILLHLFLQEIHRELLLQKGIALVLLVREHPAHRLLVPHVLACGRFDAPPCQFRGDGVGRHALKEQTENQPHGFRLLRVHHNLARLLVLVQAEEAAVGEADLAVREPLPLPPCDVFRDASAFLLRQTGHDGYQKLAFGIQRPDVFFLEVNLDARVFQLPHGGEAVHGVPREAAYALRYYSIYDTIPTFTF